MLKVDPEALGCIIKEVAETIILPRFRNLKEGDISFKKGDDPVTIADHEAEKALSTRLLDLLPGSKVLGEEVFSSNRGILDLFFGESPVWIVDPIDGTRNFVRGSPEFGVIVSLSQQNQVIVGCLYDATSGEILTAEKGSGAWYKGERLKTLPPPNHWTSLKGFLGETAVGYYNNADVAHMPKPDFEGMSVAVHEYPRLVLNKPHFGKDKPQVHFRASYGYCTPWDDAAGILIHQEAGGYFAFWDGRPYQPSIMDVGLALTPDKECWHDLKAWCQTFCTLPAEI